MKFYSAVLCAALVAVVCADHGKGKGKGGEMSEMFKSCMEESGAEKADMKSLKSEEPTPKALCAVDCVAKKMKIINADGSFNQEEADKVLAKMPEKMQESMKKAFDECKALAKAGGKECESGGMFGKCMMGKMKHQKGKGKGKGKGGKKHSAEDDD